MRDIEFRAKDIDNGKWVYGYYVKRQEYTPSPIDCTSEDWDKSLKYFIFSDGFADWNMKTPWYKTDIDPKTLGQYAEFIDKNNKKVYEGDIVKSVSEEDGEKILVVKHYAYQEASGFSLFDKDDDDDYYYDTIEIIGNIHDNTELIVS